MTALPGFGSALVARCPMTGRPWVSAPVLPGFSPGPRCAETRARFGLGYRTGVAGVRPRLSLRVADGRRHRVRAARTLPGFGPGPRCASQPPSITTGSREALPGFGPGPRCAMPTAAAPQDWSWVGVCRVLARPSLCEQGPRGAGPDPGRRCRGSSPALVARCLTATGPPSTTGDVAGAWPWPSLREVRHPAPGGPRTRRCRGPASALVVRGPTARAPRKSGGGVAGAPPRPSLRVARRGQDDRWLPEGVAEAPAPALVARPTPYCRSPTLRISHFPDPSPTTIEPPSRPLLDTEGCQFR